MEKVVGTKKVTLTPLGFFAQMEFKRRVLTPLSGLISSVISGGLDATIDIGSALENLTEIELKTVITTVLSTCTVDGRDMTNEKNADEFLSCETVLFYKIVHFFVEVNYPDFLGLILTTLAKNEEKEVESTAKL